jgi:hypothetical protein
MSDNERGESTNVTSFLLGFLTGVLVCLVLGGGFLFVAYHRTAETARAREVEARMLAEEARAAEEAARRAAAAKKPAKAP